jgi:RNA polymerase sigma factor (sigma-70 family)
VSRGVVSAGGTEGRPGSSPPGGTSVSGDFDRIYAEHHRWLLSLLRGMLRPAYRQDADDVAQDVWLALLRVMTEGRWEPARSPRPWLTVVARHRVCDLYWRRVRHPETATAPDAAVWAVLAAPELADPAICGEVRAALAALPRVLAAAVLLREGCGLHGREVAALLGCSKPTADRWARQGLAELARGVAA